MRRQSTFQRLVVTTTTTISCCLFVILFIQQQQVVVVSYTILPVQVRTFDSSSHRSRLHQVYNVNPSKLKGSRLSSLSSSISSSSSEASTTTTTTTATATVVSNEESTVVSTLTTTTPVQVPTFAFSSIDGVKVFGRLAEKYIALDSSGGQCCYSGCSNCEYRLPGGGYIMADQSSARPKWIPSYTQRNTNNNNHITKWSINFFPLSDTSSEQQQQQQQQDTPIIKTKQVLTKQNFVSILQQMEYVPPLGGPYVSGSAGATISDTDTSTIQFIEHMFNIISKGSDTISSSTKFSVRLKQLSNGDEGMTWQTFASAFHIVQ